MYLNYTVELFSPKHVLDFISFVKLYCDSDINSDSITVHCYGRDPFEGSVPITAKIYTDPIMKPHPKPTALSHLRHKLSMAMEVNVTLKNRERLLDYTIDGKTWRPWY